MNDSTTPPSGNTQTQATLFGAVGTNKGQPVTKAIKINPDGSLAIAMDATPGYITGSYRVQAGDIEVYAEGKVVAIFRADGTPALPVPYPGTSF